MDKIDSLISRLSKIGIKIELACNVPWIYIRKINGSIVTEKYYSDYGFTIAFLPIRTGQDIVFTDISEVFSLIRKYLNK